MLCYHHFLGKCRSKAPSISLSRLIASSYSSSSVLSGKRSDRKIQSTGVADMKGVDGKAIRAERRTKRLRSLVKKEIAKDSNARSRSLRSMESMVRSLFEEYGFTLHDKPGHHTVKLKKEYSYKYTCANLGVQRIGLQNITMEFDAYDESVSVGDEQPIFLVDVLVSDEKLSGKTEQPDSTIVFTCSPDRPEDSQVLSVRYVDSGESHLDQKLYDGPSLQEPYVISQDELQNLPNILREMNEGEKGDSNGDSRTEEPALEHLRGLSERFEQRLDNNDANIEGQRGLQVESGVDVHPRGAQESEAGLGSSLRGLQPRKGIHVITNALHRYLRERGIEPRSLAMARLYATHKYKQERADGMKFMFSFLE